jgi:hypothetical protein
MLNALLGLIENLGAITHLFLIALYYPANINLFRKTIFPLIVFDIFHMSIISEILFRNVKDNDPLNDSFEQVGYDSAMFIPLCGELFYYMLLYPIVLLLVKLLKRLTIRTRYWKYLNLYHVFD